MREVSRIWRKENATVLIFQYTPPTKLCERSAIYIFSQEKKKLSHENSHLDLCGCGFTFLLKPGEKAEILFKYETWYSECRHMRETFYFAREKKDEQQASEHNLIKKSASRLKHRNNIRTESFLRFKTCLCF